MRRSSRRHFCYEGDKIEHSVSKARYRTGRGGRDAGLTGNTYSEESGTDGGLLVLLEIVLNESEHDRRLANGGFTCMTSIDESNSSEVNGSVCAASAPQYGPKQAVWRW